MVSFIFKKRKVNMKTKKEEKGYLCNAIGNRGLVHAWGTGPTKEQAEEQCRLAVKESLEENHSKWRHAPFTYVIEK